MENIIRKIRQIYPVSDEALQALQANMELRYYPKDTYRYSVAFELNSYRDTYSWDVTCQGSVPVAIRCFLESEDYESFLRNVYSLSCDMDTLCAIGGGIAEEFYHGTGFEDDLLLQKYLNEELYQAVQK